VSERERVRVCVRREGRESVCESVCVWERERVSESERESECIHHINTNILSLSLSSKSVNREFLLRVSYLEIYNEVINDLLSLNLEGTNLKIRESLNVLFPQFFLNSSLSPPATKKGVFIPKLKEQIALSPNQVLAIIAAGEAHRHGTSSSSSSSDVFSVMCSSLSLSLCVYSLSLCMSLSSLLSLFSLSLTLSPQSRCHQLQSEQQPLSHSLSHHNREQKKKIRRRRRRRSRRRGR